MRPGAFVLSARPNEIDAASSVRSGSVRSAKFHLPMPENNENDETNLDTTHVANSSVERDSNADVHEDNLLS